MFVVLFFDILLYNLNLDNVPVLVFDISFLTSPAVILFP